MDFIGKIVEFLTGVLQWLIDLLPKSAVQPFIESMERPEWLGLINYFVPVGRLVTIGLAWGVGIAGFYAIQVILRWVKVIGD